MGPHLINKDLYKNTTERARERRKHELPFLPQAQMPGGKCTRAKEVLSSPSRAFEGGHLPLKAFWTFLAAPSPSEDAVPPPGVSSGCHPSSQGDGPQPPPSQGFSIAVVLPCIHRLNFLQFCRLLFYP